MSIPSQSEKWKNCFGKNSFIATMKKIDDIEEVIHFVETKPELQELIVSMVEIDHIPNLSTFTMLSFIDFSFNSIKDVKPLTDCPLLQTLILSHNDIEDIDCLSSIRTLNALDVSFNSIKSIQTSPRLGSLKASNNPLRELKICSPLRILGIDSVKLKQLELAVDSLETLSISNCDFDKIGLRCKNLKGLVANSTEIPLQSVVQSEKFSDLTMNHSSPDSINTMLSQVTTLTSVTFGCCELLEFPQGLFNQKGLAKIIIPDNPITEIPEQITQLSDLILIDVLDCLIEKSPLLTDLTKLEQFLVCFDGIKTTSDYFKQKLPKDCSVVGRDFGKFDKIIDGLYLGSYANAHNQHYLEEIGITHILTVAPLRPIFPQLFTYKQINIDDSMQEDITPYLDDCIGFIDEARRNGAVLVHCAAGISRSASVVIAYLMKKNKWSYNQSFSYTAECRPIICPNGSFIRQLKEFEQTIPSRSCLVM